MVVSNSAVATEEHFKAFAAMLIYKGTDFHIGAAAVLIGNKATP